MHRYVEELIDGVEAKDPSAAMVVHLSHSTDRPSLDEIFATPLSVKAAKKSLAATFIFDSWDKVTQQTELVRPEFEEAIDALVSGSADRLVQLLDAHPDMTTSRSAFGHHSTLLHYVAANGVEIQRQQTPPNIDELTQILIDRGANVNSSCDSYGGGPNQTTLALTVSSWHPFAAGKQADIVRVLSQNGAELDGPDGRGVPLATCLTFGYHSTALAMVDCGARVTNLVVASGLGLSDIVAQMLCATDGEASLEEQSYDDPFGGTTSGAQPLKDLALFEAARNGQANVCKQLLDNDASSQFITQSGENCLHHAALNGHLAVVRLLIERGADPLQRDQQWDSSPIIWANEGNHREIMEFLAPLSDLSLLDLVQFNLQTQLKIQLGDGDPNQAVDSGSAGALLRSAAALGHTDIIRYLLDKGADPSLTNEEGRTAIDLAREQGHEGAVELLADD